MSYRGRLLQPFVAHLARLDTDATRNFDPAGYDDVFRAPTLRYESGVRIENRQEMATIQLRCQVEMGQWRAQRQAASGETPDTRLTLVFHQAELEQKSLIDPATGDPLIRVNDRLVAIYDVRGNLVQTIAKDQGGLYVVEVQPTAYGLGRRRNLVVCIFDERPQGQVA